MILNRMLHLGSIIVFILIMGTACGSITKQNVLSTRPTSDLVINDKPNKENQLRKKNETIKPIIIAEGTPDENNNRMNITIRIIMTDGKEINDLEPGPFQGTFRSGKFEVVAIDSNSKEVARLSLNDIFDGGEMSFREEAPFELLFDDYNEDGHPDFTIGQWGGSNGNLYCILTVGPNGFSILARNIYSADHDPSIRYRKIGDKAFLNKYYDQEKGTYMDKIYRWKDGVFYSDMPVEAKEISSAGKEHT
jgi:hypothetical protein